MTRKIINLTKPEKYENRDYYMSKIYFRKTTLPIKIKKCQFKVINFNKVNDDTIFFICEFLNNTPLLYDFMLEVENNIIESIIKNSEEWFNVNFSKDSIDNLFISNLKMINENSKKISFFMKNTNNIENVKNSTIELDLFIENVHFDKDKFYIPLISYDYKKISNI